ncbi:MAG: tRNA (adenosine(37)-N6)-dimethylallyltransferase MiaA [Anaerovoracaceae bacterium]|jgi:tRNA dimethylallyltransferase
MKPRIVAVTGPTAVGKTECTLKLARAIDAEIVSCDSMQLYKYLDIGSAKPTPEERAQVRHYLVDEIDPAGEFSVAKYKKLAERAIDEILGKGKVPLVTGGTGLYLDSILYDMDFGPEPAAGTSQRRAELIKYAETEGNEALHALLEKQDPEAAARIHPNNVVRVARALEAAERGEKIAPFTDSRRKSGKYDAILIGLTRDRQELYDRINMRVGMMIDAGLVDEVRGLRGRGLTRGDISMKGIGYKEIFDYLDGSCTLDEAADTIRKNTRHFAKRQMTWFRRYDDIKWFCLTGRDEDEVAEEITKWVRKRL